MNEDPGAIPRDTCEQGQRDDLVSREDSSVIWMMRGFLLGLLFLGAMNALSFFFRSKGWGSLLGHRDPDDEAIGFPFLVWQEAGGYGSHMLRWPAFAMDIGAGIVFGLVLGAIAIWFKPALNQMMHRFRNKPREEVKLQFSVRGLLITTVLAALAAAGVRSFAARVEVLAAIYAVGPLALIILAYLPRKLSWQQRVAIIAPAAIVLIACAITLGHVLQVDFDKVLMGIFICWTPQTTFAALLAIAVMIHRETRLSQPLT